jgi:TolB-like protein
MPFAVNGDAPEAKLFAAGLAADVSTDLGRFRSFDVIAHSAFASAPDPAAVLINARTDYLVGGHLLLINDIVRANIWLVESDTRRQLWGERWEHKKGDLPMLQTEIAQEIVSQIPVETRDEELVRLQNRHTPKLGAYQLTLEARTAFDDPSPDSNTAAREKLLAAIA